MIFPRKGLASVYGFLVLFLLITAGLSTFSSVMSAQYRVIDANQRAQQLIQQAKAERLTVSWGASGIVATNDGGALSRVTNLLLVGPSSEQSRTFSQQILPGDSLQISIPVGIQKAGIVTAFGNVFWLAKEPLTGVNYTVSFDAQGVAQNLGNSTILTVDGSQFAPSQLPRFFSWSSGSLHSYSYTLGFATGAGSRIGWSDARGLSSSRTGQLLVDQPGGVLADYATQYLLQVSGGSNVQYSASSPSGDGFYNAGTQVQVSTDYTWSSIAAQSRQSLLAWSLDTATPALVQRHASGRYTSTLTMSSPHTLQFDSQQQYYLGSTGGNGVTYSPSPTGDQWYDSGSTASATSNYVWSEVAGQSRQNLVSWNIDGGPSTSIARANTGNYATSATMDTYHTVNLNAATQYYLTLATSVPNGVVPFLSVSDSYQSKSTTVLQSASCGPVGCTANFGSGVSTANAGLIVVTISFASNGAGCYGTGSFAISDTLHTPFSAAASACSPASRGKALYYGAPSANGVDGVTCSGNNVNLASFSCSATEVKGASTTVHVSSNSGDCLSLCAASVSSISWAPNAYVINPWDSACSNSDCSVTQAYSSPPSSPNSFPYSLYTPSGWDLYWAEIAFAADPLTLTTSGSVATSSSTYAVSGTSVAYSYQFSNSFPAASTSRQFIFTVPSMETYSSISCGSPTVSAHTITIGDADIASCNAVFTITTTSSGTFSASTSGSQTGDNWYDSGSSAAITSTSVAPFSFGSWSGSATIANTSTTSTTVTMTNFYTVTASYNVNP